MARKAHGSHVPPKPAAWQAHLRTAIEAAYGSINGYAKYLAGDGATRQEIDSKRRGIQKWLQVDKKPVTPAVKSVTRLLQDGIQIDPEVFPRGLDRPRPYTVAELGELVEAAIANQESERDLLQGLSENIAAAVRAAETNGESIEDLRSEIESLRDDLRRGGSTGPRKRRAS